ncbi:S1C family serine protease [Streptomyces buecherae]|uniref:S1C family serine protease n=1 Tax=Streptomyces buecherae TaxID=2763006 RepID=UPI001C27051B|nr:trypsin-like peptidase domain-containing protein [Streptomyces buecherae]
MNDGKTPRPKPKWWSRPHMGFAGQPHAADQAPHAADEPTPEQPAGQTPPRTDAVDGAVERDAAGTEAADARDATAGAAPAAPDAPGTDFVLAKAAPSDAPGPADQTPEPGPDVRPASATSDASAAGDATTDGTPAGDATVAGAATSDGLGGPGGPGGDAMSDGSDGPGGDAVPGGAGAGAAASGVATAGDAVGGAGVRPAEVSATGGAESAAPAAGEGAPAERPRPRHEPDPYSTPPYGEPGPWAPAPPVQHPVATPAHGTHVPPHHANPPHPGMTPAHGTTMPAHPAPGPQPYPAHQHPQPAAGQPAQAPGVYAAQAGRENQPGAQWQHYDPWRAPVAGAGQPGPARAARRRGPLVVGALVLALLAGGIGGGIGVYLERETGDTEQIHLPQAPSDTQRARDPDSIAGIAARALPSVVTIHVKGAGERGTGTGFVLDKRGNILTNNHVVEPADQGDSDAAISVTFNGGQTARAKIVGRDAGYDLAVIRVQGVTGLKPLALGNSDSVRVGDPVVAIGAPYDLAGTVTSGIISAKGRPITAGGEKVDGSDISYVDALQTDAPINPGNSGGPLVNADAQVIGINSVIRAANDGGLGGGQGGSIGLGFAIPINQGKRVAEELINTGKATHPVIGVTLDMKFRGEGARVAESGSDGPAVTEGGPGDKAGIRSGDVITKVDGVPVRSGQELIVKIRSHRPGDRLKLTLERDGDERTVELALGSASDMDR